MGATIPRGSVFTRPHWRSHPDWWIWASLTYHQKRRVERLCALGHSRELVHRVMSEIWRGTA